MVTHTRVLGVFVPSNRRMPTAVERNVHAVRVVAAPPFTKERRDELDGSMAHYRTLSDDELKALVRERGISLRGRRARAHWIKALDGPILHQDRKTYDAWKADAKSQMQIQRTPYIPPPPPPPEPQSSDERKRDNYYERVKELKKRQGLMFASPYKADPDRLSFMDLPVEIRNIIYRLSLFIRAVFDDIKVYYCPTRDVLVSHRRQYHAQPIAEEIMFSVLNMLGALNKEVRREIRCCFYTNMPLVIQGKWQANMDMPTVIHDFLRKIDAEGRASLPELDIIPYGGWHLEYEMTGFAKLNSMLGSIAMCQNIRYFSLELTVAQIFAPDMQHLKAYFLEDKPLVSPNLDAFCNTLTAMKALRLVHIRVRPTRGMELEDKDDVAFTCFAFTGIRQLMLYADFVDRVQGNDVLGKSDNFARKLSNIHVWTNFYPAWKLRPGSDEMLKYSEWLEVYNQKEEKEDVDENVEQEDNAEGGEGGENSVHELAGEEGE